MASGTSAASADKDALINLYNDRIIPYSLTGGGSSEKEVIDIVSSFPWTANQLKSGNVGDSSVSFQHNIPFCYIVERKQTVNSNIMNVINTWKAGLDVIGNNAAKIAGGIGDVAGKVAQAVSNSVSSEPKKEETPPQEQQAQSDKIDTNVAGEHSTGKTADTAKPTETKAEAQADPAKTTTTGEAVKGAVDSIAKPLIGMIDSIKGFYEGQLKKWTQVESGNLNTNVLQPYKYLYLTKETGKRYVFPMLTPTDLLNVTTSWGDSQAGGFKIGDFDITEVAKQTIEVVQTMANLVDVFSGKGNIETAYMEMAKAFNFNSEGPEITTNFVLFNTTKKDAWKTNFRFLSLFMLRNLPFKVSSYSFIPPLMYDITVPGIKHLPLCYVSNIQITSHGNIRHLTTTNYIKDIVGAGVASNTTLIPVPEAWQVAITFKCLLSNTANLVLDLANAPINITTANINAG